MNALAVGWLVFLALIKSPLTATEGSCIEIKCNVTNNVEPKDAYWFWIKNPHWSVNDFTGTIIYSTNETVRPVSSDFADRVKYTGSPSLSWNNRPRSPPVLCSILICNLNKTDSGNYAFRFVGTKVWKTEDANLKVIGKYINQESVNESGMITLTCSTSSSCTSKLQIGGLTQLSPTPQQRNNEKTKSTTVTLTVNWNDDGKEFSCKTQDNEDKYLIKNISVTVEYAPKYTLAEISSQNVEEGRSVTLTCSAKGSPTPTFTWVKNKQDVIIINQPKEIISSVSDRPEIEVKSSASVVKEGEIMTLTCKVKRSNPPPSTYSWFKDEKAIHQEQTHQYVVERIQPEDRGSYTCSATNTVGTGTSGSLLITVEYGPWNTTIRNVDKKVKVGSSLAFYCFTDANPAPLSYSWYRYNMKKPTDSSKWRSKNSKEEVIYLDRVERADEACYMCNATNEISTGHDSEPVYPPTEPMLTMDTELREDQLITISCTVESFPLSTLYLTRTSESKPQSSELLFTQLWPDNTLHHKFNVTSTHTGVYTCSATNSEGSKTSKPTTLVVKYRPKDVTVKAEPALIVNENKSLTLRCSAQSHPPVTSVTWMKTTDGKSEIIRKGLTFILKSVSPSDSGLYSCAANNGIGTGNSQKAEVKVKYAPKHTNITRAAEQQQPDGTRSVELSCSSHSYPPVTQYSWYKIKAEEGDEKVSNHQTYTVYSNEPGSYYCIAKNEINQRKSDPVHLFDRDPTSNVNSVYCTVNLPSGKQVGQNDERLEDYENVSAAHTAKSQNASNYDTDTSEDEIEINYSQVSFKAKPGLQRAGRDSSSSDEEVTQYSEVKI
uniref:B-cell receptor CD22 n=1 Tax=Sander lucioperca TaxID=283035 RepID=A0A8C9YCJ4_SANLU